MPGSKSAYLSKALLDHVLGKTTYTAPSTVYAALSSTAWDPTKTGAAMDELTGTSYARVAITNNTTDWPNATYAAPAVKANGTDISFPAAGASDWEDPLSVVLVDASSAGNVLYGADLNDVSAPASGDVFKVLANTWIFSED